MMKEIDIRDGRQVKKINRLAGAEPYEVWLCTETVMLDARSLLSLFSLVGKKARVVVEDDIDPKRFDRLVDQMK